MLEAGRLSQRQSDFIPETEGGRTAHVEPASRLYNFPKASSASSRQAELSGRENEQAIGRSNYCKRKIISPNYFASIFSEGLLVRHPNIVLKFLLSHNNKINPHLLHWFSLQGFFWGR